ncbi:MAG: carboxypeptidase-like regulatory domain-containing protein [Candidatus Poseidoniaceae archaeon]
MAEEEKNNTSPDQQKDYLTDIIEESGDVVFASSNVLLKIEKRELHSRAKWIAILILFVAMSGFLNGLDYASPDSGLIRPDEFVYALTAGAPENSAIFSGTVLDENGNPMQNVSINIQWQQNNTWLSKQIPVDENGYFEQENLTPALTRVDVIKDGPEYKDVLTVPVLLSPPALFEPYGFTEINFIFPGESEFESSECEAGEGNCTIRYVDLRDELKEDPLMDNRAAGLYVMVGFFFMGLATISFIFVGLAFKTQMIAFVRGAALMAFFSMGHYYIACLFGLFALALTFAVPKQNPLLQD